MSTGDPGRAQPRSPPRDPRQDQVRGLRGSLGRLQLRGEEAQRLRGLYRHLGDLIQAEAGLTRALLGGAEAELLRTRRRLRGLRHRRGRGQTPQVLGSRPERGARLPELREPLGPVWPQWGGEGQGEPRPSPRPCGEPEETPGSPPGTPPETPQVSHLSQRLSQLRAEAAALRGRLRGGHLGTPPHRDPSPPGSGGVAAARRDLGQVSHALGGAAARLERILTHLGQVQAPPPPRDPLALLALLQVRLRGGAGPGLAPPPEPAQPPRPPQEEPPAPPPSSEDEAAPAPPPSRALLKRRARLLLRGGRGGAGTDQCGTV